MVAVPPPVTWPFIMTASCAVMTMAICWLLAWAWSSCWRMLPADTPKTTATASTAATAAVPAARASRPGQASERSHLAARAC